jgi:hypothetical protein
MDEGIVSRDELFITSKLWNTDHHPAAVEPACRRTLKDLQVMYPTDTKTLNTERPPRLILLLGNMITMIAPMDQPYLTPIHFHTLPHIVYYAPH